MNDFFDNTENENPDKKDFEDDKEIGPSNSSESDQADENHEPTMNQERSDDSSQPNQTQDSQPSNQNPYGQEPPKEQSYTPYSYNQYQSPYTSPQNQPYSNNQNQPYSNQNQPYTNGQNNNNYTQNHPSQNQDWIFPDYDQPNNFNNSMNHPKKPRKNKGLIALIVVISVIVVFSIGGVGVYTLHQSGFFEQLTNESESTNSGPNVVINNKPTDNTSTTNNTSGKLTTPQIAKKVRPSVVGIVVYTRSQDIENMGESTGQGSGIIMSKDGYIITNAHVVEGADGIKVVLDNSEEYEATLVGKDTKTDLAVIKIKANNLTAANFGDSSQMEVGETVIAIGNPSGLDLAGSVTQGIVSAVDRLVKGSSGYSMKCIQTDAAINPGNSGGALVNQYGQVIGINSAKIAATEYEGIGFSIPMNEAKPIIDNLIKYGYIKDRARLGISFQMIDEVYAKIKDVPTGLYIKEIDQTTDTYKKGVRVGDIVTKIDGKKITDADAVSELLKTKKPGQTVKLTVYRLSLTGGNPSTFDVTVALGEDRGEATNNQQSITP